MGMVWKSWFRFGPSAAIAAACKISTGSCCDPVLRSVAVSRSRIGVPELAFPNPELALLACTFGDLHLNGQPINLFGYFLYLMASATRAEGTAPSSCIRE